MHSQPSDLQTPPGSACTIADLRFGLYCSSLPPFITYTWTLEPCRRGALDDRFSRLDLKGHVPTLVLLFEKGTGALVDRSARTPRAVA